jgi:hypothetical protein
VSQSPDRLATPSSHKIQALKYAVDNEAPDWDYYEDEYEEELYNLRS